MNGKSIVFIGALAAGAYLLLRSGVGGGAEGGGTKKATAITGVVPGFDGGSVGSPGSGETSIGGSTGGSISSPFQPSQYLMDLISQKYNPVETKKAVSVETSQYKYGDKLGSIGNGSTNAFDVIAVSMPKSLSQAIAGVSPNMMTPITEAQKSALAGSPVITSKKTDTPILSGLISGLNPNLMTRITEAQKSALAGSPVITSKTTTASKKINSTVNNTAPHYSTGKYGGWS